MKTILVSLAAMMSVSASAYDYCAKFKNNVHEVKVKQLSERLMYSWEEFCDHPRIMDVQHEVRNYFYMDSQEFEDHNVYTLHYNEYSCDYHFNIPRGTWMKEKDYCYNTW